MKKLMLFPLVAAALLCGAPRAVLAQDAKQAAQATPAKPVAVVSISGYQDLLDDVDYLGRLAGRPNAAQGIEGLLKLFTQNKGLVGLDRERPWGVIMSADMQGYAFVPVTDLNALLKVLVAFVGTPEDAGDGILELTVQDEPLFVKEQGGWAFLSGDPENLTALPDDPAALLGDLPEQYNVALRGSPQNLPPQIRQVFLSQVEAAVEEGLREKLPGETDEVFELRQQAARAQVEALQTMANEIADLTVGFAIDAEAHSTYLDLSIAAVEGSTLARELSAPAVETRFAGLNRPDALFRLSTASDISAADQPQALAGVEQIRKQLLAQIDNEGQGSDTAQLKEVANGFCDVLAATIETGRMDGGLAVVGGGPISILGGFHVGDSAKVRAGIMDLLDAAQGQPGVSDIKRDAATHRGVTFHSMVVTLPEPPPAAAGEKPAAGANGVPAAQDTERQQALAARALFGEKVTVVFGVSGDATYFGMGADPQAELIRVIDESEAAVEKTIAPFELALRPSLMIQAAALANPEDKNLAAVAKNLPESDHDQVRLLIQSQAGRMQLRLEIGEGVIPILAVAGAMAQQAGAGAAPGF